MLKRDWLLALLIMTALSAAMYILYTAGVVEGRGQVQCVKERQLRMSYYLGFDDGRQRIDKED